MKVEDLNKSGTIAVVFAAKGTPYAKIHTKGTETLSSGRLRISLPVRNWDHYVAAERNGIWYTTICKDPNNEYKYVIRPQPPINALLGSRLACPILQEPWTNPTADLDINFEATL